MSRNKTVVINRIRYESKPVVPSGPSPYELLARDLKRAGDHVLVFQANVTEPCLRLHLKKEMNGQKFSLTHGDGEGVYRAWLHVSTNGTPAKHRKPYSPEYQAKLREQLAWMRERAKANARARKGLDSVQAGA